MQIRQLVPFGTVHPAPLLPFELVELPNKCSVRHMKRVEAKIEENRKEDSASEPDKTRTPGFSRQRSEGNEEVFHSQHKNQRTDRAGPRWGCFACNRDCFLPVFGLARSTVAGLRIICFV